MDGNWHNGDSGVAGAEEYGTCPQCGGRPTARDGAGRYEPPSALHRPSAARMAHSADSGGTAFPNSL